jgi:hypothetical protein
LEKPTDILTSVQQLVWSIFKVGRLFVSYIAKPEMSRYTILLLARKIVKEGFKNGVSLTDFGTSRWSQQQASSGAMLILFNRGS